MSPAACESTQSRRTAMGKSFCNSNGCSNPSGAVNGGSGTQASPATVTVTGVHLGAGDTHWWKLV
jgi:hypothetical protein